MLFTRGDAVNKKRIDALRKQIANPHLHKGAVVCTACQKPLAVEESMIAGMGPVCLERSRFAEHISRQELAHLEGPKEPLSKGLYPARTMLLKLKFEDTPRFVTVLSAENNSALVIDRTEMNEEYAKTGSIADAIVSSLYNFEPHEGEHVSSIVNPKDADLARDFKKFQKHIREMYKERSEFLKQNPLNSYYNQVLSKKGLSETQLEAREKLLEAKDLDPEKFQDSWGKGKIHLVTWSSRLKATQLSEARLLAEALDAKVKNSGVEEKDYGLTDAEIIAGLAHSNQVLEKNLFKTFLDGSEFLPVALDMYKKFPSMDLSDKMFTNKILGEISSKKALDPELKAQWKDVLSKNKISERGLF